jgi:REP element-mobilizing transposase RayT
MPQSLSRVWVHIIFSTKGRYPFLIDKTSSRAHAYMAGILKNLGALVGEIGGTEDHVHILCCLPRTLSAARLVEEVKKSSSQKMKADGITNFYWQRGYGSFSVSQSEVETVPRYIKRQKERHRKMSFQEEYKIFLKKHRVDYDEKFVWD